MLGLILIYFLGKAFYDLADKHEKHKWANALSAIALYYGTTLIVGFAIGIYLVYTDQEDFNETVVGLISIPFGLLACWFFYNYKKRKFENRLPKNLDTLDGNFLTEN